MTRPPEVHALLTSADLDEDDVAMVPVETLAVLRTYVERLELAAADLRAATTREGLTCKVETRRCPGCARPVRAVVCPTHCATCGPLADPDESMI